MDRPADPAHPAASERTDRSSADPPSADVSSGSQGDAAAPAPPAAPTVPPLPPGVRVVREEARRVGGVDVRVHPGWAGRFPWLAQGTTVRGEAADPFDLALFGRGDPARVQERWRRLGDAVGASRLVHGRQVHGATVRFHREGPPGLQVSPDTDGHVTRSPGVLLTVSTADCIPVSVVDPVRRAVAALHGGWRGVAAGILERGIEVLGERVASRPADLHVHLGPAICGRCYEVGPEVHEALGLQAPAAPTPVDLRAVVADRAVGAGVPVERISVSGWCTRCAGSPFFSHRAGCAERQVGFVGLVG